MDRLCKPAEWSFNKLLLNIAKDITVREISVLKRMVIGNGMLQEVEVQEVTNAVELFSILRDKQYLNSKNVECLRQMLMLIKRKDLITRAIDYCQTEREEEMMRTCNTTDEDLVPGHSYVRFYVDNHDSGDFNINFINYFKIRMSTMMFIPVGNIIVSGFESFNTKCQENFIAGFVITFMLPDLYIEILHDLLEDKEKLSALKLFGVKRIEIHNKMYKLIDGDVGVNTCSPLDVHKDFVHELILEREKRPEVWSKQLANRDQFSNSGHLDNEYNKKLSRINQVSGMSITLWKNFGKVNESETRPHISHDELQRKCLHAKVARIYPQLTYEKERGASDLSAKRADPRA